MKKITFNDKYGLTQAVLDGRKTMTRRTIPRKIINDAETYVQRIHGTGHDWMDYVLEHPTYPTGQLVAVAQSYQTILNTVFADDQQWAYGYIREVENAHELLWEDIPGRTNKMFVKADQMPFAIRITNVSIERLQDISDEDCLKEGIYNWKDAPDCPTLTRKSSIELYGFDGVWDGFVSPRAAFAALIDKICGKETWDRNPWVFAYAFEPLKLE